ncbi:MAG: hypothetical protein PHS64_00370 [Candidatus Omnitrophica bacterium]|nr:hypothetical protein [Candidatus Omnitrophota bacterium]
MDNSKLVPIGAALLNRSLSRSTTFPFLTFVAPLIRIDTLGSTIFHISASGAAVMATISALNSLAFLKYRLTDAVVPDPVIPITTSPACTGAQPSSVSIL